MIHGLSGFSRAIRLPGLISGIVLVALLPGIASADDVAPDARTAGSAVDGQAQDTVVYLGADYAHTGTGTDGYGLGIGFTTALSGDLDTAGPILSGNVGVSRSTESGSRTHSLYSSILLGYLWQAPGYYFSASAGLNYLTNDENPSGGATDGDAVGAIVQYGFETKGVDALYFQSYGAYSTAYDQIYFHAKAGYKASPLRFGPELTVFDEETGKPTVRYGVFIGDIPVMESLSMVISAGYQQETEQGEKDGYYATMGFSVPFSLR